MGQEKYLKKFGHTFSKLNENYKLKMEAAQT